MNELIIIRGVSGSGKTTFAKKLIDENKADMFFEADQYFIRPDGVYDFNAKMLSNAHNWCLGQVTSELIFHRAMDPGNFKRVIVSNTFTRLWEMKEYLDVCEKYKITFKVYRCDGRFENTHGVPSEKVQQMRDRFEDYEGEIIVNGE